MPPPEPSPRHTQAELARHGEQEAELLQRIRRELPPETTTRYRELIERRRAEVLTEAEHSELLRLTDEAERLQAERVESLAELAHLRRTSLAAVARELEIHPLLSA